MKRSIVFSALAATLILSGCKNMKDAFSAHSDEVATAESQKLTVTRMSELLGRSQAPLRKDVASALANIWVNYQLVGIAAARNDSLGDEKALDEALWPFIANMKAKTWYDSVAKGWAKPDSTQAVAMYNSGEVMTAAHILILTQGMTPAQKAQALQKAKSIRASLTPANFAAVAKKESQDKQSGQAGGMLPPFRTGDMVPEFEKGVKDTKPGEISGIVESQFGYHIIRRAPYDEVKSQLLQAAAAGSMARADSAYMAKLEKDAKVEIKPSIAQKVRDITVDPETNLEDKTVLATWKGGKLTGGRLARWVQGIPPQAGIAQRIMSAPDTVVPQFVMNFVRNELILAEAEKNNIKPKEAELKSLRQNFLLELANTKSMLGMESKSIADSAKARNVTPEVIAAQRADAYIEGLMNQRAQYIPIAAPISHVLRKKYDWEVSTAGIDRAMEQAQKIRNRADSAAAVAAPPSTVPMPAPKDSGAPKDSQARR